LTELLKIYLTMCDKLVNHYDHKVQYFAKFPVYDNYILENHTAQPDLVWVTTIWSYRGLPDFSAAPELRSVGFPLHVGMACHCVKKTTNIVLWM